VRVDTPCYVWFVFSTSPEENGRETEERTEEATEHMGSMGIPSSESVEKDGTRKLSIAPAGVNGRKTEAPRKVKYFGGPVAQIGIARSLSHSTTSCSCFSRVFSGISPDLMGRM